MKQYQTLLSYDDVELEFLTMKPPFKKSPIKPSNARQGRVVFAHHRRNHARCYVSSVPSQENVKLVRITKEAADGTGNPSPETAQRGDCMEINTHNAEILLSAANKSHYPQG